MQNHNLNRRGLRRADADGPRPLADAVLRLIWQERRISRAEIARHAKLSRSTVSEIVNEILPMGLIAEIGEGPSRGGRPPIVLEFRDDACVILGVEMGATHVVVTLIDLRGKVLSWKSREHPVRSDPAGTRKLIAELCKDCLLASAVGARPLVGIGVAVPCPVDPFGNHRLSTVVLPEWEGELGLEGLAKQYDVPLMVDNDANLGALAEHWWGVGRGVDDIAYIKVATGIGSGHVIGGEIYRGATGVAGEIGHIAIDPQGKPCICGLRGCLVTLIGGQALLERATELRGEYPKSTLAAGEHTVREIEDAALAGDPLALQVAQEAANYLGRAVASLLNLMNPSLVIVGGDLARLGDLLIHPLRDTVEKRTLVSSVTAAQIRASELGFRSTAIGAATLVLKAALADSRLFPRVPAPKSPAAHKS
ncbi:MAG TPA: ROK family transcriptional regulator [Candidatus Krumholzibacteria bacterium]|nr:ROK family transcriptional regulator [Candidatus Krumholzibacteria bacterium]